MPKVDKNKAGKAVEQGKSHRLRDAAITVLATPLNIVFIALRLVWQGRKTRLAALTLVGALAVSVVFRFDMLAPVAEMVSAQTYKLTASAGFEVNDITVEGRQRTQREALIEAINVAQGSSIFALDLDEIHARIEALPWVEDAIVLRRLPNILHVSLTERQPFAFYREPDNLVLIDRKGVTITRHHLKPFAHLPIFSGDGASLRAASFMETLRGYPVLRNRMVAAHWTGQRRWTVRLDHGGQVHLPEGNIGDARDRLMQLEKERRILAVERQEIDLRLPDRVLLRPDSQRSERKGKPEVAS